jgi:hypothetical protein
MYTVFFISFVVSCTSFGWYLYPSPGAPLQRTSIGLYGFGVLFHRSSYWFGTPFHLSAVSYRQSATDRA